MTENRQIQERVNETGEFFISGTKMHGRFTLRLAIGNWLPLRSHVDRVWELIQLRAAKLAR